LKIKVPSEFLGTFILTDKLNLYKSVQPGELIEWSYICGARGKYMLQYFQKKMSRYMSIFIVQVHDGIPVCTDQ